MVFSTLKGTKQKVLFQRECIFDTMPTGYSGYIIARIELFPAIEDGIIPYLTMKSWFHMDFEGKQGLFSAYCTFIGVDRCYAGESADVRLYVVAFPIVEEFMKVGVHFKVCKPIAHIGNGVIKEVLGREG